VETGTWSAPAQITVSDTGEWSASVQIDITGAVVYGDWSAPAAITVQPSEQFGEWSDYYPITVTSLRARTFWVDGDHWAWVAPDGKAARWLGAVVGPSEGVPVRFFWSGAESWHYVDKNGVHRSIGGEDLGAAGSLRDRTFWVDMDGHWRWVAGGRIWGFAVQTVELFWEDALTAVGVGTQAAGVAKAYDAIATFDELWSHEAVDRGEYKEWSDTLTAVGQGLKTGTGQFGYLANASFAEEWTLEEVSRVVNLSWQDALTAMGEAQREGTRAFSYQAVASLVEQWSKQEVDRAADTKEWTDTLTATGIGSVNKGIPTVAPASPTLAKSGNSLTATWTNTATDYTVRVTYQSLDWFLQVDFDHSASFDIAAGSVSHVWNKPEPAPEGYTTRMAVQYISPAGSGPSSGWSNNVTW
jgi:hypothetical protein